VSIVISVEKMQIFPPVYFTLPLKGSPWMSGSGIQN